MNAGGNDNETEALSNYGFLYGTIPTAPSVFVYATNYAIQGRFYSSNRFKLMIKIFCILLCFQYKNLE